MAKHSFPRLKTPSLSFLKHNPALFSAARKKLQGGSWEEKGARALCLCSEFKDDTFPLGLGLLKRQESHGSHLTTAVCRTGRRASFSSWLLQRLLRYITQIMLNIKQVWSKVNLYDIIQGAGRMNTAPWLLILSVHHSHEPTDLCPLDLERARLPSGLRSANGDKSAVTSILVWSPNTQVMAPLDTWIVNHNRGNNMWHSLNMSRNVGSMLRWMHFIWHWVHWEQFGIYVSCKGHSGTCTGKAGAPSTLSQASNAPTCYKIYHISSNTVSVSPCSFVLHTPPLWDFLLFNYKSDRLVKSESNHLRAI